MKLRNKNFQHAVGIKDFCQKLMSNNIMISYHLSVSVADYSNVLLTICDDASN